MFVLEFKPQFLNYPLHKDLREFSGVDVSGVRSTDPADSEWERQTPERHGNVGEMGEELDGPSGLPIPEPPMAGPTEIRGVWGSAGP